MFLKKAFKAISFIDCFNSIKTFFSIILFYFSLKIFHKFYTKKLE